MSADQNSAAQITSIPSLLCFSFVNFSMKKAKEQKRSYAERYAGILDVYN